MKPATRLTPDQLIAPWMQLFDSWVRNRYRIRGLATILGLIFPLLIIGLTASPVQAQEQFNNERILFTQDTIIEFEFVGADSLYRSIFGVMSLDTGDRFPLMTERQAPGQPPNVGIAEPSIAEFRFQANTPYIFYLDSRLNGQPAGVLYSLSSRNPNNERLLIFDGSLNDLASGRGIVLRWDDTGSLIAPPSQQDRDFDDFVVRAGGYLVCTES